MDFFKGSLGDAGGTFRTAGGSVRLNVSILRENARHLLAKAPLLPAAGKRDREPRRALPAATAARLDHGAMLSRHVTMARGRTGLDCPLVLVALRA